MLPVCVTVSRSRQRWQSSRSIWTPSWWVEVLRIAVVMGQQKPGLIDIMMKRREHRLWRDSYSQARAEPQKRFRTKNRQDDTTGATAIVV
eukprot:1951625-Rhodomonas_salina.1